MQQKDKIESFGTRIAKPRDMSGPPFTVQSPLRPTEYRPGATLFSLVAAKAGREVLWVVIAGVFLVVEALVFVTELPATKFFHRREPAKVARAGRR